MPPAVRVAVLVKHAALVLALAASAMLYIDYRNAGDPAFCGVASGCFAVRISPYSHVLGIPLPTIALPAFALLLGGSLLARGVEQHRIVAGAAGFGALAAAALIVIQAVAVKAFCMWCVLVDSSAILAGCAAAAVAVWAGNSDARAAAVSMRGSSAAGWGAAGALAVGLPFVWAEFPVVPPAPPEIAAEAQAGKVTIVSFTDFECPFCRKLHPVLDAVREKHGAKLHFVRKMKPLAGHPGAMPAAKAFVCAPEAKRDAVAAALYEAESHDLTDKKLAALADKMDLGGRDAFAQCLASKETEDAVERDSALFAKVAGRGLPLTWVNARAVVGFNPDGLVRAVNNELGGPRPGLPIAALLGALAVLIATAAVTSWRALGGPRAAAAK